MLSLALTVAVTIGGGDTLRAGDARSLFHILQIHTIYILLLKFILLLNDLYIYIYIYYLEATPLQRGRQPPG
jgi:hypothetical protein